MPKKRSKKKYNKDKSLYFIIPLLILIIVGVIYYFNVKQEVLYENAIQYKSVDYNLDTIIYREVIPPSGDVFKQNHVWRQWSGGNRGEFNPLLKNVNLLNFYVHSRLKVDIADFTAVKSNTEGDDDTDRYLKPKYCETKPDPTAIYAFVDNDGCPHWTYLSNDYGGSTDGTKNYKNIFESENWEFECRNPGGSPELYVGCYWKTTTSQALENLESMADSMSCVAAGNDYSLIGSVSWEGLKGFNCFVESRSGNASGGTVTFQIDTSQTTITIYRLENNACTSMNILESERTSNDYDTLVLCETHIIIGGNITIYRLENNQCNSYTILESNKLSTDYTTLALCQAAITNGNGTNGGNNVTRCTSNNNCSSGFECVSGICKAIVIGTKITCYKDVNFIEQSIFSTQECTSVLVEAVACNEINGYYPTNDECLENADIGINYLTVGLLGGGIIIAVIVILFFVFNKMKGKKRRR